MFGLALEELAVLSFVLGSQVFWIWALADSAARCPREHRVTWVLVIALLNVPGAVLYLLRRRSWVADARPSDTAGP
ncbi:MAG: PLDc N-terminal domain-containing protein [Acidobacteriota bacterium]